MPPRTSSCVPDATGCNEDIFSEILSPSSTVVNRMSMDALASAATTFESTPPETIENLALVTLAGLAVQRGNYRLAAVRLQELLDRYPANANQLTTRLQLADCYRRLAAQEPLRQALVQWLRAVVRRMREEDSDEQDHR